MKNVNYEQQAQDFLAKTGTKFSTKYVAWDYYFGGDKEERAIFRIFLEKDGKKWDFSFGQSIAKRREEPDAYSVLSCLTKHDVGTFEDFCGEFGYDAEDKKTKTIYKNVCNEYSNLQRLYSEEEIELMRDIN